MKNEIEIKAAEAIKQEGLHGEYPTLTVKELIACLKGYPQDAYVMIDTNHLDAEGDFTVSRLAFVDFGEFNPDGMTIHHGSGDYHGLRPLGSGTVIWLSSSDACDGTAYENAQAKKGSKDSKEPNAQYEPPKYIMEEE